MASILMNSSSCWSISLTIFSTLSLFLLSVVICNHLRASGMTLQNWLYCLRSVWLIFFCFFWNILLWPEWYNYVCFLNFNDDKNKTLCRGFSATENFYITPYRYDVIEHSNVGEYMRFWSYFQLCIVNLGGTCLDVVTLVFT